MNSSTFEKSPENTSQPETTSADAEKFAEVQEGVQKFEGGLTEIVEFKTREGGLQGEEAENYAKEFRAQFEALSAEQKAAVMKELAEERQMPEKMEQKKIGAAEAQKESIEKDEEKVQELAARAKELGINVPIEDLRSFLEKFKNIEPGEEDESEEEKEALEWKKYFNEQFAALEAQVQALEEQKKAGQPLTPEAKQKAEENMKLTLDELTAKTMEWAAKLMFKVLKGLFKGLWRAIQKEGGGRAI